MVRNIKARSFAEAGALSPSSWPKTCSKRKKRRYRKFVELAYAFKMEMRYSKDEILTMYINQAYGDTARGAARSRRGPTSGSRPRTSRYRRAPCWRAFTEP